MREHKTYLRVAAPNVEPGTEPNRKISVQGGDKDAKEREKNRIVIKVVYSRIITSNISPSS